VTDTSVLLDFEVYDIAGNKVLQTALDNQALPANAVASFSTSLVLPASLPAGQYTFKAGAFSPGWGALYAWSDSAGTFVVDTSLAPLPTATTDSGAPAVPAPNPASSVPD